MVAVGFDFDQGRFARPGSSQRQTPPKKSKAHQEATCLENLSELGKILDEVQTRMMDQKKDAPHQHGHQSIVRVMKELHSNIIESRKEGSGAHGLCPKCSQSTRSADKEQQTTTVWKERCRGEN
ncbi:GL13405 [Drosophila persimilis]|uniref:GL13405 n=1 Tax=Drosophila persimilis TaxID=7234 RepID=B4HCP9_DROPE|nr:GL13405 [Drosophila persimilis]